MDLLVEKQVYLILTVGILVMLSLALAFVLFFNWSQKKIFQQQLLRQDLELSHQQNLLYGTIVAQEKERQRIAQDLHDDVGSKLNVIFLHLHRLRKLNKQSKNLQEPLIELHALLQTTIETSRRIAHDLLPPTLEKFGLSEAVEELCNHYERTEAISVTLQVETVHQSVLSKFEELTFYRILQELFHNTIKYASAKRIDIKLKTTSRHVQLTYKDDGKGFDMNDREVQTGLGLRNIANRMNMINGTYELKTMPSEGMSIQLKKSLITTTH